MLIDRPGPGTSVSSAERTSVVAAAIALFVATLAWRFLTFTGFTNDHYAHLALAQQMLLGDRPVRDFSDPGWPLTYLISAAAWLAAGDRMAIEWAISSGALAIGAAFTLIAAYRLSGSLAIALLVSVIEILISPRTYSYPKVLAYAVAGWALIAVAVRPGVARVVAMAAIVAIAFLLRHDHGLYIGVASAVCVAVASGADGWRLAVRRVALLTAATAAWLLPWIVFVTLNGGLGAYFETALEYARGEANASNLTSWPTLTLEPGQPLFGLARPDRPLVQIEWTADTTDAVRGTLERRYGLEFVRAGEDSRFYYAHDTSAENIEALGDDAHVTGTTGLGRAARPAWREVVAAVSPFRLAPALHRGANADAWLFWLFWTLPVVAGVMVCRRALLNRRAGPSGSASRTRIPNEFSVIAALVGLALLVNAGFLRDILRTRFADAIVPQALLGAWVLGVCWTEPWRRRALQRFVQVITVAVLTVSSAAISYVAELPERIDDTGIRDGVDGVRARFLAVSRLLGQRHRQDLAPPSRVAGALMPFFEYLDRCTSESDRLIVTGEFPDVIVLSGRRFASDGAVFGAWYSSARNQARTVERMRTRPPLFALYMDVAAFRSRLPLVAQYLDAEHAPMADILVEGADSIPILVQRTRVPVRTDPQTGWPCFR